MRRLRVLNYAINGIGIGHVTRVKAVARWLKRLAPMSGVEIESFYITSSDVDRIIGDNQPIFKVPSPSVLRMNPGYQMSLRQAARDCVWSIMERTRPDLLIVDTVPAGSFDELLPRLGFEAMSLCRKKLFIYRPSRLTELSRLKFEAMLPKYDLILIPEMETSDVLIPDGVRERTECCGPIISCDREDMLDRKSALEALKLTEYGLHVYVSVGGGGHRNAEARLLKTCEILERVKDVQVIVGAGPLYQGRRGVSHNSVWLNSLDIASNLAAVDVAVSAAGYNSFNELMLAGVPTIFLPLDAAIDDQWKRAKRAEDVGAGVVLSDPEDPKLVDTIELWRGRAEHSIAAAAAKQLVPENCARKVAERAISLCNGSNC